MKYIPLIVVKNILDRCYMDNPEVFMSGMMDVEGFFGKELSEVVEKIVDDPHYRDWAFNELKGVPYGDDTE